VVLGWRAAFTRVTVAYSLLGLPALSLHYYLRESTPSWVDVVYGLVPLMIVARSAQLPAWLRRRIRDEDVSTERRANSAA
ncbi:MAG: hypothetical protein M3069_23060, partial [Chloroflexota bacterium]|nr:hypothetical protein [Chloroflexota bacterium]